MNILRNGSGNWKLRNKVTVRYLNKKKYLNLSYQYFGAEAVWQRAFWLVPEQNFCVSSGSDNIYR